MGLTSVFTQFWKARNDYKKGKKNCPNCDALLSEAELEDSKYICPKCNHHLRMPVRARINLITDKDSFTELFHEITPVDCINFIDSKPYTQRIDEALKSEKNNPSEGSWLDVNEAITTGNATIDGIPVLLGVMNFDFMGGSMGSVVGERVTRLFEEGVHTKKPVIIVTSSGGARMQEGINSLMQMAKTSAAVSRFKKTGLPYIVVLADPTTGGVSASFATLGDINIAEPGALIGFAGPRVIEQTIRQKLPKGFQRSQFLLEHGMIDAIVDRSDLKATLSRLLNMILANRGN